MDIPIWVCANQPCTQLGFRYLGSRRCGSGGFLKLDGENLRKWGCCGALLAQRATKPVEDEKPVDSPGENNQTQVAHFSGFHRDLNSLPKALSATDLSSSPSDGSKVRVAYQGVPGAYSEVAALKVYPRCETVPCDQFEAAFKAVELWLVDKAVLPIENSVGGSIHRNYDLLLRHRLNIVGEVQMVVNHCLLGLRGVRKEELKRVLSHPQALDQCEMSLHKLGVVKVNADDTAGAAQIVAADGLRDTGAVASARAAEIYGLDILAERIQDDSDNVTRFLILAREPIIPGIDKPHKTSIVFTLEEGPGVLFKALAVFALRDINLSKIESRPQRKRPLRVVDDCNKGSARNLQDSFGSLVATPWIQLYRKQLYSRQSSDYSLFSQAAARQTFQPSSLYISNTFSWWKRISSCIFDEVASKWDGLPYMDIFPFFFPHILFNFLLMERGLGM
ncbi:arogenate dehydratase/prephenate dehydratase 1, chloroplastic isoform X2 [Rhododendron vialii]|uniref:arogenate dehydratase/prephenate dehydratase 1, chloroplastic isoform X2 n=1 Tax=Rhododendron vialii TaxID=182163 RepID=UPI00265E8A20|nr:arogenate dehydratase/prephenate dehydratase 1, chloroplastic isoform X2 [Rhododendron vialii]